MDIIIRDTIFSDLEQLPWLYRQGYNGDSKIETNIKGMIKEFKNFNRNKDYKFISAMCGDKLVGFCSVVSNHDILEQRPILTLWNLRVHSEYRKQYIGKSIMNYVEQFGKSVNAYAVLLCCDNDNTNAMNFYAKIGYEKLPAFIKLI